MENTAFCLCFSKILLYKKLYSVYAHGGNNDVFALPGIEKGCPSGQSAVFHDDNGFVTGGNNYLNLQQLLLIVLIQAALSLNI